MKGPLQSGTNDNITWTIISHTASSVESPEQLSTTVFTYEVFSYFKLVYADFVLAPEPTATPTATPEPTPTPTAVPTPVPILGVKSIFVAPGSKSIFEIPNITNTVIKDLVLLGSHDNMNWSIISHTKSSDESHTQLNTTVFTDEVFSYFKYVYADFVLFINPEDTVLELYQYFADFATDTLTYSAVVSSNSTTVTFSDGMSVGSLATITDTTDVRPHITFRAMNSLGEFIRDTLVITLFVSLDANIGTPAITGLSFSVIVSGIRKDNMTVELLDSADVQLATSGNLLTNRTHTFTRAEMDTGTFNYTIRLIDKRNDTMTYMLNGIVLSKVPVPSQTQSAIVDPYPTSPNVMVTMQIGDTGKYMFNEEDGEILFRHGMIIFSVPQSNPLGFSGLGASQVRYSGENFAGMKDNVPCYYGDVTLAMLSPYYVLSTWTLDLIDYNALSGQNMGNADRIRSVVLKLPSKMSIVEHEEFDDVDLISLFHTDSQWRDRIYTVTSTNNSLLTATINADSDSGTAVMSLQKKSRMDNASRFNTGNATLDILVAYDGYQSVIQVDVEILDNIIPEISSSLSQNRCNIIVHYMVHPDR